MMPLLITTELLPDGKIDTHIVSGKIIPVSYIILSGQGYDIDPGIGNILPLTEEEKTLVKTNFPLDVEPIKRKGYVTSATILTERPKTDKRSERIETLIYCAVSDVNGNKVPARFINGNPNFSPYGGGLVDYANDEKGARKQHFKYIAKTLEFLEKLEESPFLLEI